MTESDWLTTADPQLMLSFLRDRGASERKTRLFWVACCRRVAHLLTDRRVRTALALLEQSCDRSVDRERLVAAGPELADAVEAAFHERWSAEAYANFTRHPAYSAASATESAVYAVGALFDELTAGLGTPVLDRGHGTEGSPHEHARWAAHLSASALSHLASLSLHPLEERQAAVEVGKRLVARVEEGELLAQAGFIRDIFGNPFRVVSFAPSWRSENVVLMAKRLYESRDFSAMPVFGDALEEAGCHDEQLLEHCRGPGPHVRGCYVIDLALQKN